MSLFKKKENEFSTGKKRPKLKPIGGAQEKAGTSGKGGGEPAKPTYDVNSKGWSDQLASFNKKGGRNNDGALGYGYVDENTGIEVPWYIDMINGGGANAAGDTFVSPFAEMPFGGGMLSMPSRLANAANIAPYGSNQPRYFMPMEAGRVDAEGKSVQTDLGPAAYSVGGGSSTVTPDPINVPQDFSNLSNAPTIRSGLVDYSPQVVAGTPDPYGVGQGGEMAGVSMPSGLLMNQPARTPPSAIEMPQTVAPSVPQDPAYNEFVEKVRNDPMFVGIIDNPEAMRNIYTMYKQQMGM